MIDANKETEEFMNESDPGSLGSDYIDVDTGEIAVVSRPIILRAIALGSCVAVTIYDRYRRIGGLAHIMLPGRSLSEETENKTKYAKDSLDILFDSVKKLGVKTEDLEVNIVGGANVLREGDVPDRVTESVLGYLKELDVTWKSKRTGGTERRSVFLNTASGKVFYTEGDSAASEL